MILKRVRIRSYPGPHFCCIFLHSDWIRRDTPYISVFSPNAEEWRKNADQNNSEYWLFLSSATLDGSVILRNRKLLFCWRPPIFTSNQCNKIFLKSRICHKKFWTEVLIELCNRKVWFRPKWKSFNNWFVFPPYCRDFCKSFGTKFFFVFGKLTKQVFYLESFIKTAFDKIF